MKLFNEIFVDFGFFSYICSVLKKQKLLTIKKVELNYGSVLSFISS